MKLSLLENFALTILDMLYSHTATFPSPPIMAPIFNVLITDYATKYAGYRARSVPKANMLAAKNALITALDTLSNYVNDIANGNDVIILESGFIPTKGNASNVTPPLQPTGVTLVRGNSRELIAECAAAANVDFNGAILAADEPLSEDIYINSDGQIVVTDDDDATPSASAVTAIKFIVDLTKGRKKKFSNLQVGVKYYVYFWATNSAGVSILSEGVSKNVVE
jgi:hypothetical protein